MNPHNNFVRPLLTDLYEITMAYAYWKSNRHEDHAVFDLFFRENPFGGAFTIFAGVEEIIHYLREFRFRDDDLNFVSSILPGVDQTFLKWLKEIDCSLIKVYALREGTLAFPHIPLIRVEGPLAIAQLLETTLLNLVNYPSLIATNAARMRLAVGKNIRLLEFGLRRAQGPDGGVSASRYSYLGGFDATSNVLAAKLFRIPVKGTHAHSFVSTFSSLHDIRNPEIRDSKGLKHDFVDIALRYRTETGFIHTNEGELASFIAYAQAFPERFLALVDTYDTLGSGIPNFLIVALALSSIGYSPIGIRLDSGDLSYLSKQAREMFRWISKKFNVDFSNLTIVASNNINEATLRSLAEQRHEIDIFGIGTHLVTCQSQPALGGVYKLVSINDDPKIKLSQEVSKITIPGRKEAYRLVGQEGYPLLDLMIMTGDTVPSPGERILCRHPFEEVKRVYVNPSVVIQLHQCIWDGQQTVEFRTLDEQRQYVSDQIDCFRPDHLRPLNPTPYKVSVSEQLYHFIHDLWLKEAPITEMK